MSLARRLRRAWQVLTWRHWAWATGVAVAIAASMPFQNLDQNAYWILQRIAYHLPWFLFFAYVFLAAVAWTESDAGPRAFSGSRALVAALVAGTVCIVVSTSLSDLVARPPRTVIEGRMVAPRPVQHPELKRRLPGVVLGLYGGLFGSLAMCVYVCLRNSRRAARALAEAEFARAESSRKLLVSNLKAANAELEPDLVHEWLASIESAYVTNPRVAEAQLDELIGFLRAAIPRTR